MKKRQHGLTLIRIALALAALGMHLDPSIPDPIPVGVIIGGTLFLLFWIQVIGDAWDRRKPRRLRNRAKTNALRASITPLVSTLNTKQPVRTSPEWRHAWRRAGPGPAQKATDPSLRERLDAARQACELLLQQLAAGGGDEAAQSYAVAAENHR